MTVQPAAGPAVSEHGVVNAAVLSAFGERELFGPRLLPVAPGSLVVVRGENFTGGESFAAEGFPLPASLGGVTVRFDGLQARLLSVGPQHIETQAPSLLGMEALEAGETALAAVVVETAEGSSYPRRFLVAAHAPGVFTVSGAGTGQAAALLVGAGALAAPRGASGESRPARVGDVLQIYATGLGPVYPPVADGENSCAPDGVCRADGANVALRHTAERPRVSIGRRAVFGTCPGVGGGKRGAGRSSRRHRAVRRGGGTHRRRRQSESTRRHDSRRIGRESGARRRTGEVDTISLPPTVRGRVRVRNWCGEGDSNPQGIAPTSTSS